MELRHLRYFVAVAESGGFTAAAKRLAMSQPPLSMQIRDLERELGVRLFDRTGRKAVLTEGGRLFLKDARRILAEAENAKARLDDALAGRLGALRLGCDPAAMGGKLTRRLRKFLRRVPGLAVAIDWGDAGRLVRGVGSGLLDACIAHRGEERPELKAVSIRSEPILVAVSRKHAIAERKELTLNELSGLRFFVGEYGSEPAWAQAVYGRLRESGLAFETAARSGMRNEWLIEVALGLGCVICTVAEAERGGDEVAAIPIGGPGLQIDVAVITPAGETALAVAPLIEQLANPG